MANEGPVDVAVNDQAGSLVAEGVAQLAVLGVCHRRPPQVRRAGVHDEKITVTQLSRQSL